jgi:hypothetical protein
MISERKEGETTSRFKRERDSPWTAAPCRCFAVYEFDRSYGGPGQPRLARLVASAGTARRRWQDAALQDKPQPASASLLDLRRVCCDFGHHSLHLRVDVTVGD